MIYLDSAASSWKPEFMYEKIEEYYTSYGVNIHRGLYAQSVRATKEYEGARRKVARFIGAKDNEIVFTYGTTDVLNLLASSLSLKKGDEVVISQMEHHANMIPWIKLVKDKGVVLKYIPLRDDLSLDMVAAKKLIGEKTKVVSIVHLSNSIGVLNDVKEICSLASQVGAYSIVDAAQSIAHMKIDVNDIGCDFLAFSGHKIYGPTGIGVLYGRKLDELDVYRVGGDMIDTVSYDSFTVADIPARFEAGTPNIAGAIGLGAAIDYVNFLTIEKIESHLNDLSYYAKEKLDGFRIVGDHSHGIISIVVDGVHAHDVAVFMASKGIAIRAGHHCCEPLMKKMGVNGTVRVSFGYLNNKKDVDAFVKALHEARGLFNVNN